jgi:hypothetical protein
MAEQPSRWMIPPMATSPLTCLLSTQVAQAPTRVTRARYFMFSRQAGRQRIEAADSRSSRSWLWHGRRPGRQVLEQREVLAAERAGPLPEPLVLRDDAPVLQVELQVHHLHGLCSSGSQPPQPQPACMRTYVWRVCGCRKLLRLLLLQPGQRNLEKLEQSTLVTSSSSFS